MQAQTAAFFRVELGGKEVAAAQSRTEIGPVAGNGIDIFLPGGPGEIGMDKVKLIAGGDAIKQGVGLNDPYLVPSHVGNLEQPVLYFETDGLAGDQAEAFLATFLGVVKDNLGAEANTEYGGTGFECLPQGSVQ